MRYGITRASPSMIAQEQRITALPSDPQETLLARYILQLTQQNKVGTPEYYLAAGEFQDRQKMRQEQAAKQQQGPKVVENLTAQAVQKAAPQMAMAAPMAQGVGALDAGGMDRIESPIYTGAMGGIVAFDEGGQAKGDSRGDQIEQLYTTNLMRASDPEGYRFWSEKFGPEIDAAERALFIAEAAPEVQRRIAAGDTSLPEYMRVDPAARRALQSKDVTTEDFKTLANYFGNQFIGGEAEDPASLTRRDYIERPRSGYDLATFLASRSQQHGAQPDTKQRFTNLMTPFMNVDTSEAPAEMRYIGGEGNEFGYVVTNPLTGEREMAYPSGALGPTQEGRYRTSYGVHHSSIGDPDRTRYAVGLDYLIDPKTGRARLVEPYLEGYQERRRDNSFPIKALATMAGASAFPGMDLSNMIKRGLISLGNKSVSQMASGGEVQRFQGQGPSFVQSARTSGLGVVGAGMPDPRRNLFQFTPEEEEEQRRLREMSLLEKLRYLASKGIDKISAMEPRRLQDIVAGQPATVVPTVAPAAVAPAAVAQAAQPAPAAAPTTEQAAPPAAPTDRFGLLSIPGLARPNYSLLKSEAENIAGEFAGTTPIVPTGADAARKALDIYAAANVDFDLFKKQAEALTKEKANIKLDKREAGSIRLIEAGLGILGGESPHAFVNIGKGASPALKGLAEDLKDIKKLDRERDKEIRNLQVAQNQLRAGVGKDAAAIISQAEQRLDTFNREDRQLRASIFNNLISSETTRAVAELNARVQLGVAKATRESSREDALLRSARDLARREIDAKVRSSPTIVTDPKFDYDAEVDKREAEILQRWKLTGRVAPVETQAQGVLGPRNPDGTIDYRLIRPRS